MTAVPLVGQGERPSKERKMGESEDHAVRWPTKYVEKNKMLFWSKWHITNDAMFTICGQPIPIGGVAQAPLFPETDDDLSVCDCKNCLKKYKQPGE